MPFPVSWASPLPKGRQTQNWADLCPLVSCVCFQGTPVPSEVTGRDPPLA